MTGLRRRSVLGRNFSKFRGLKLGFADFSFFKGIFFFLNAPLALSSLKDFLLLNVTQLPFLSLPYASSSSSFLP
jgi:hypothetical protein